MSPGSEELRTAQAELVSRLDPEGVAELLKSMTDVRVALSVDIVGLDDLDAYALAKKEAARLWSWPGLTEPLLDATEPEAVEGGDGALRVGVLVGVTDREPADAVREACAVLKHLRWTAPTSRTVAEHQFAYWQAAPRPARGVVRIEVHVGPGLSPITERQRQEMLADPDYAHLHEILRMV